MRSALCPPGWASSPRARPHLAAMAGGGRDGGGARRGAGTGPGPAVALRGPLMAAAGGSRLLAARYREHGSVPAAVVGCSRGVVCVGSTGSHGCKLRG